MVEKSNSEACLDTEFQPVEVFDEVDVAYADEQQQTANGQTPPTQPEEVDQNVSTDQQQQQQSGTRIQRLVSQTKVVAQRSAKGLKTASINVKDKAMRFDEEHQVSTTVKKSAKAASTKVQCTCIGQKVKSFNENHHVGSKTRYTAEVMGTQIKRGCSSTVKGVKKFESKHQIVAQSQRGLSKGADVVRNVWNGKGFGRRRRNDEENEATIPSITVTENAASA